MNQTIRTFSIYETNPIFNENFKSDKIKKKEPLREIKQKSQHTVLIQQSLLKDLEDFLTGRRENSARTPKLDY